MTRWLVWLAAIAGCSFGDNLAQRQGNAAPDAAGHEPADAAISTDGTAVGEVDASVPPPDASAPACVLVPQAGCSGATPACDLTTGIDPGCRAVTKQGTSNDHCTLATDCKAGFTCIHDTEPSDAPFCSRFCLHDGDCTGTGSRCVDGLDDDNGKPIGVTVCSNACDPFGQTGCPSGMGCIGVDDAGGDFTDCIYMAGKPDGSACTTTNECLAGSVCVDDAGTATCEPYCHVNNAATCTSGTTCTGFASPLVIAGIEYGACQ
jgi:hypothetical protein